MDPFEQYGDEQLIEVLKQVDLYEALKNRNQTKKAENAQEIEIGQLPLKNEEILKTKVEESGSNFS